MQLDTMYCVTRQESRVGTTLEHGAAAARHSSPLSNYYFISQPTREDVHDYTPQKPQSKNKTAEWKGLSNMKHFTLKGRRLSMCVMKRKGKHRL